MARLAPGALLLLLACALGLRLWGMQQGYPNFYGHVDEVGVAASIWNFFRNETLLPTEFTYPAFYPYLVAAGIAVSSIVGLVDLPSGGTWLERLAFLSYVDPGYSALVGRALSAVASTAMVAVLFRIGQQVGGARVAWIAALLAAMAHIPVRHAHQALPDSLTGLLGALVLYAALRIHARGDWLAYGMAGVCTGLMLATKYNGAVVALAVVAAHLLRAQSWRAVLHPRLWATGAIAVVSTVAASPYLLLAYDLYLGIAQYQVSSLDFSLQQTQPWLWIPLGLATHELVLGGWILVGVGIAVWRRNSIDVIALSSIVPAALYIGSWTRESLHYLLPYYPFLLLLAACAVVGVSRRLDGGSTRALVAVAALTSVPSLWADVGLARDLRRPDTRSMAASWVEEHVPSGSTIGMTWLPYCPRLDLVDARQGLLAAYRDRPEWQSLLRDRWRDRPAYRVVNLEAWLSQPVVPEALRDSVDLTDPETRRVFSRGWRSRARLRSDGVDYVVLPTAAYERYLRPGSSARTAAARFRLMVNRGYFQDLLDGAGSERVATVPEDGQPARGGPIDIIRLR